MTEEGSPRALEEAWKESLKCCFSVQSSSLRSEVSRSAEPEAQAPGLGLGLAAPSGGVGDLADEIHVTLSDSTTELPGLG